MDRASPKVRATYVALEKRIRQLAPGEALPGIPELCRTLSVSQLTIDRAYEALETQGLIERRKGSGVFVVDRTQTGEFAIVLQPGLLAANASPYFRVVTANLIHLLRRENPRWRIRMHVGGPSEPGEPFLGTLDLMEPDVLPRLRGVFAFSPVYDLGPALEKAGVPLVHIGSFKDCNYEVAFDQFEGFVRQALRHLRDSGCTTAGMIGHSMPPQRNLAKLFTAQAGACGLETHPEWIEQLQVHDDISERAAYEAFMRWQAGPHRPQGLVVQDDVMCNGVLRATLKLGVQLPRDLRLVSFAIRGVELGYHLPVSRVEFDGKELAERAVDLMLKLVRQRPVTELPLILPGRTIKGETT